MTLFRVSRMLIEKGSTVFKTMFSLPQGDDDGGNQHEGHSDAHPIVLPGVTADEFRDFLKVLYAKYVPKTRPFGHI